MKNELQKTKPWVIYLLECGDGSFYTGITNDLDKRLNTHNAGLGAKYTRGRLPLKLLEFKLVENHSTALKLEAHIKKLPKSKKRAFFCELE
jgi:putative endonuclease